MYKWSVKCTEILPSYLQRSQTVCCTNATTWQRSQYQLTKYCLLRLQAYRIALPAKLFSHSLSSITNPISFLSVCLSLPLYLSLSLFLDISECHNYMSNYMSLNTYVARARSSSVSSFSHSSFLHRLFNSLF